MTETAEPTGLALHKDIIPSRFERIGLGAYRVVHGRTGFSIAVFSTNIPMTIILDAVGKLRRLDWDFDDIDDLPESTWKAAAKIIAAARGEALVQDIEWVMAHEFLMGTEVIG